MGLFPGVWGPAQWMTLHMQAECYPLKPDAKRQKQMLDYMKNLCPNLPCPGCSGHCDTYTTEHPPDVSSRHALKKYFFDFHNAVNKRTNKRVLSYEEAEEAVRGYMVVKGEKLGILFRAQHMRQADHKAITELRRDYDATLARSSDITEAHVFVLATVLITVIVAVAVVLRK